MVNDTLPLPAEGPAQTPPAAGVPARAFDGRSTQARAVLLPCLSRCDVQRFAPGDAADPTYGELFRQALAAGVEIMPCRYSFDAEGVHWLGLAEVVARQPGH